MSNVDQKLLAFRARAINIKRPVKEAQAIAKDDLADLRKEMKSAGCSKAEISGVMQSADQSFDDSDKIEARNAARDVADMLAASGSAPLFGAVA